jgi:hypothetical protein
MMIAGGNSACRCCQKFLKTGFIWHCQACWDEFHNGKTDKDWMNEEEFIRSRGGREVCDEQVRRIKSLMVRRHTEAEQ